MYITLYSDGFQAAMRLYATLLYKFEFLSNWSPVEVHFYKADGTRLVLQNDKMHTHQAVHSDEMSRLCKRALVPSKHDPMCFEYRDMETWWIAPCTSCESVFPAYISGVLLYTVLTNPLREFV